MSGIERLNLEKDVLYEAEKAKRDYAATKVRLAICGERLERLGKALQNNPELVQPLPEIGSPDYRAELNLLNARDEIIELCSEVRTLQDKIKVTTQRNTALGW